MGIIYHFFETNLILVYFIYPLIFFLMGFGILLKNIFHSRFFLANSLQYLALFGILHGISDWGNIFIPIQKVYLSENYIYFLNSLKLIINALSFFFLFYFGVHLLVRTKKWDRRILFIPPVMLIIWFLNFISLEPYLVNETNHEWWIAISDIWARYLIAFPGGAISSYALFLQREQFRNLGVSFMTKRLNFAAFSVGLYAITGGLIVPYAPVMPAILFNSDLFFSTTGLPVELFRALSGLLMAFFMLKILKVFDIEYQNYIHQTEKQKAITDERNMIARDLHDGMIQSIYAIGLHLERVRNMLLDREQNKIEQAEVEIQGVNKKLNDIIKEIRGYIKQLKMPGDQQISFKEEIEKLIKEKNINNKVHFSLQYNYTGDEPALSRTVQIYYIIKEALSNIIRHANATETLIKIDGNKDNLNIEIIDNGVGMKSVVEQIKLDENNFFKQGIKNMKYRAQSIGGKLNITSSEGKGTKIALRINCKRSGINEQKNKSTPG